MKLIKKKRGVSISAIYVFMLFSQLHAQDTLNIRLGFFFNPQGVLSIKNPDKAFSLATPLFAVCSFSKGKEVVNIMYNVTSNRVQSVYFHKFTPLLGMYLLANKNILLSGGYAAVGLTRVVAEGRAVGFIETGSTWNASNPIMALGVIVPFTFKVK